jgi:hypothetical protein
MATNKPPAVNPKFIRFDPKGNAQEHNRVERQDRRLNENVPMAERERRAARARAEAAARERQPREETQPDPTYVASDGGMPERESLIEAPLGLNETGDDVPLEDVSGDVDPELETEPSEPDDHEWSDPLDGEEELWTPGGDDALGDDAVGEGHTHGYTPKPEDIDVPEPDDPTRGGKVFWPGDAANSDEFQSFMLGDRFKVRNPVTGESMVMALISFDWDTEGNICNLVYAPVQEQ